MRLKKYISDKDVSSAASDEKFVLDDCVSIAADIVNYRNCPLKPNQRDGIKFLYARIFPEGVCDATQSDGAILAHDMGLGKSRQAVVFINTIVTNEVLNASVKKILIVVPVSLLLKWEDEFEKWLPSPLNVEVFGKNSKTKAEKKAVVEAWKASKTHSILIIGYEMFRQNTDFKLIENADLLVLDEAHRIKNELSIVANVLQNCDTKKRILLTGDATDYEQRVKAQACKEIHQKSASVIHRRTVKILGDDLPQKKEYIIKGCLQENQVELYKTFLENYAKEIRRSEHQLTRICAHANVVDSFIRQQKYNGRDDEFAWYEEWRTKFQGKIQKHDYEAGTKLHLVLEIIRQCEDDFSKIIIFSSSLDTLAYLEMVLKSLSKSWSDKPDFSWKLGHDYVMIDGSTAPPKRKLYVDRFNDAENHRLRVMLITKQCGATGLTIIGANRMVLLEPSWCHSEDSQAVGRIFRIGQKKDVSVYRFIAAGTHEERILESQIQKESITRSAVDGTSVATKELLSLTNDLTYRNVPRRNDIQTYGDEVLVHLMKKCSELNIDIQNYDEVFEEENQMDEAFAQESQPEKDQEVPQPCIEPQNNKPNFDDEWDL
uniref:Uncharacterized protein n=1 Tax=Panagrolaimus sp. ES5 TaxID=591445 RepID=A0AC34FZQ7_9BILA